jgi:hypothetical protein
MERSEGRAGASAKRFGNVTLEFASALPGRLRGRASQREGNNLKTLSQRNLGNLIHARLIGTQRTCVAQRGTGPVVAKSATASGQQMSQFGNTIEIAEPIVQSASA